MELVQIDCTRIVLLTVLMLLVYLRIYRKGITLRLRKTDVVSVLIYTVIVVLAEGTDREAAAKIMRELFPKLN